MSGQDNSGQGSNALPTDFMNAALDAMNDMEKIQQLKLELRSALNPFKPPLTNYLYASRLLFNELQRLQEKVKEELSGKQKQQEALPNPDGPVIQLQEKIYIPEKKYPKYSFVGRILGPKGTTNKLREAEFGCKFSIRGRGSIKDKKREDALRNNPRMEHLKDDKHVLITVEDTANRASIKMKRAVDEINKLLVPKGIQSLVRRIQLNRKEQDEDKRQQLRDVAILNGTFRPPPSQLAQHRSASLTPAFPNAATFTTPPQFLQQPQHQQMMVSNTMLQELQVMPNVVPQTQSLSLYDPSLVVVQSPQGMSSAATAAATGIHQQYNYTALVNNSAAFATASNAQQQFASAAVSGNAQQRQLTQFASAAGPLQLLQQPGQLQAIAGIQQQQQVVTQSTVGGARHYPLPLQTAAGPQQAIAGIPPQQPQGRRVMLPSTSGAARYKPYGKKPPKGGK